MSYYIKKPVTIEAITFDELVQFGRENGANIVNDMPWSFQYKGQPITHENDDCYLIPTLEGTMKFNRGEMLITGVQGEIYPCKMDIFEATYEPSPSQPLGVHDGKDWTKPENWPALVGKRVMMISGLGAYYGTLKRHSPLWCVDNRGGLREESIKLIEPIDTPKTDMKTKAFKIGSIATAPNGNKFTRYDDALWYDEDESGTPLDDGIVSRLGLTVTSPPQAPRIADFHFPDGKYNGQDLPLSFKGKDCKAILSEDVLATIKCHRGTNPERIFNQDGVPLHAVIAKLPGDNFTVIVLKGDS